MARIWRMIRAELPELPPPHERYDGTLLNQSQNKASKVNNLRALLSLGRIAKWRASPGRTSPRGRSSP